MNAPDPPDRGGSDDKDDKDGNKINQVCSDDSNSTDSSDKKIAAVSSEEFAARQLQMGEDQERQHAQLEQQRVAQLEDEPIQHMLDSEQVGLHPIYYEAIGIPNHDEENSYDTMPTRNWNQAVDALSHNASMGSLETNNISLDQDMSPYSSVETLEDMGMDRLTLDRIRNILRSDQENNSQNGKDNPEIDSSRHVLQLDQYPSDQTEENNLDRNVSQIDQYLNDQSGKNSSNNHICESKNYCAFPSYGRNNFKRRGSRFRSDGTFDDRKRTYWLERGQEKNEGNSRKKVNAREAIGTSTDSITDDNEETEQYATSLNNIGFTGTHEEMQRMLEEDEIARAIAQIAEIELEGMVIMESSDESSDLTPSDVSKNIESTDSNESSK